ncbi:MAG: asparaginase [Bacteroidales bacterium]|nr:asparaginase [Bacteroidales bacterium]
MKSSSKKSILVIYTGGTIGMIKDVGTGVLKPFNFDSVYEHLPSLKLFDFTIDNYCFDPVIDSSNMQPKYWIEIARVIEKKYEDYDGFVVLHGSDTMAYTASALSFMFENLNKPVILTGSQLPLGMVRTDGRENFVTALEIAAATIDDTPIVPEVAIYFENQLMRGNRTIKFNAENFEAFRSPNYPPLATVGIHIKYNHAQIRKPNFKKLRLNTNLCTDIVILKLFPGITENTIRAILQTDGLRGIIFETYGTGNAPTEKWLLDLLADTVDKGIVILNVTQCQGGSVDMEKYQTGMALKKVGVLSGNDITTEAAIAKMMHVLANYKKPSEINSMMISTIAGEVTMDK